MVWRAGRLTARRNRSPALCERKRSGRRMVTNIGTWMLGMRGEVESQLSAEHARKVAGAFDEPALGVADGEPVPLLWHWAFFTPDTPTASLGPDGHPLMPAGGPTEGLPRRMWAGSRIHAHGELIFGRAAIQRTTVLRADRKVGRMGPLLVVTLEHRILQGGEVVRTEEQDLVYRGTDNAAARSNNPTGELGRSTADWSEVREIDPVMAFRFSAVTFNSHRIHYDVPYAVEVEGYEGLVVQGPLTAMLLFNAGQRMLSTKASTFAFRATAPLLVGSPFTLSGRSLGGEVELDVVRSDRVSCMTALLK